MRHIVPPPVLLAAGCAAVMLVFLCHDISTPLVIQKVAVGTAEKVLQAKGDAFVQPTQVDPLVYATMAARPLFFPTRRPPSPTVGGIVAPSLPSLDFLLVGVVEAPDQNVALVQMPGQQVADLVHVGTVIDGWTVTKINESSIDVHAGNTSCRVRIVP